MIITKLIASVVIAVVAGIPAWIYLAARHLLSPEGFWQEFVLLGAGLYVLGFAQVVFGLAGLFVLAIVWLDVEV